MYASKFGMDREKMMQRLWGDNFFDPATKKWSTKHTGAETCNRAWVQFCYNPIKTVIEAAMNDNREKLIPMLEKLGIKAKMKQDDFMLSGKPLMKRIMQTWMPAHEALLEMMIFHLPSPAHAQRYRVENLYEGPLDDKYAESMRTCNADGPLMMYISKMIPAADKGRFFAFGRVFGGKIGTGHKARRRRRRRRRGLRQPPSPPSPPRGRHPTARPDKPLTLPAPPPCAAGAHHGPELRVRPEEGPVRQVRSAHRAVHGPPPGRGG